MTAKVQRVYPTGAGTYLTTSLSELITLSAAQRFVIDKVSVSNHNAAERTVTFQIIPSGQSATNAFRIVNAEPIAGGENVDLPQLKQTLNPGDSLQALASATGSITVFVSGRMFT